MDVKPIQDILVVLMICLVRITAIFSIAPFFNKQIVPGVARNAVMVALALFIFPMVFPTYPQDAHLTLPLYVSLLFKEIIIGVIMGFLSGFIFWVAESVGCVLDVQSGSSMASILDPTLGTQTSLLGSFMLQMVMALFFVTGSFLAFLSVVFESYKIWPVFSFFPNFGHLFPMFFLRLLDEMMAIVITFGGPIIFLMFLVEFGLGMISRFAPQLNVFFLAMPVKRAACVFAFILYTTFLMDFFKHKFLYDNKILIFFKEFFC